MAQRKSSGRTPSERRSREALKELVLEAGLEVLERDGVGFHTDTVTYRRVFEHLEETQGIRVTQASVHERIWPSQREFQLDVISRAAHWTPDFSGLRVEEALKRVLSDPDPAHDKASLQRRLIFELAPELFEQGASNHAYLEWIGLALALSAPRHDGSDEAARVAEGVRRSYEALKSQQRLAHVGVMQSLDQFPQDSFIEPEVAIDLMVDLALALAQGLAVRRRFDPDALEPVRVRFDPDSDPTLAHPFAVGLWALARTILEPVAEGEAPQGRSNTTP